MAKLREFLKTLDKDSYDDDDLKSLAETSLDNTTNKKKQVDDVVSHDLRRIQKAVEDEAERDGVNVSGMTLRVVM